jgi:ABC-type transporter Mla subunit MlaD
MPEDAFRIVITVAVCLACIAFVVQAGVVIALYRVASRMQKKIAPVVDRADAVVKQAAPVVAKVGPLVDRTGPILDATRGILTRAQKIVEEAHPRITEISTEAVAISKSVREQVDHIGDLLGDASTKAKDRLDQIDRSVDNTVEHLEHAGDAMKRAVLRPVREVNGLAHGISAAVSTLVHGSRRSSVDAATQDEEMFI